MRRVNTIRYNVEKSCKDWTQQFQSFSKGLASKNRQPTSSSWYVWRRRNKLATVSMKNTVWQEWLREGLQVMSSMCVPVYRIRQVEWWLSSSVSQFFLWDDRWCWLIGGRKRRWRKGELRWMPRNCGARHQEALPLPLQRRYWGGVRSHLQSPLWGWCEPPLQTGARTRDGPWSCGWSYGTLDSAAPRTGSYGMRSPP